MAEKVKEFKPAPAAYYGVLYSMIQQLGYDNGYAIALHGSMHRDMDLIACPWTETAIDAEELVKLIAKALEAYIIKDDTATAIRVRDKPHGRKGYTMLLEFEFYIDLSIMPKLAT